MPPTTIHVAPTLEAFISLAEHQSQTPTSFYNAKPVLHYHARQAHAIVPQDQVAKLPLFDSTTSASTASAEADLPDDRRTELVDIFVSSENVTLFNPTRSTGISLPYPSIALHAIQRVRSPKDPSSQVQGLYMQLELADANGVGEDDDMEAVELTLVPPESIDSISTGMQSLFEAISSCSNLHPDPDLDADEDMDTFDNRIVFEGNVGHEGLNGLPGVSQGVSDGGLPPPFPGSGGWITAENVSEYFDEDGNWIGDIPDTTSTLGDGAGRVRTRDEIDGEGINGHGHPDLDDGKRQRIDDEAP